MSTPRITVYIGLFYPGSVIPKHPDKHGWREAVMTSSINKSREMVPHGILSHSLFSHNHGVEEFARV